MLAGHRGPQPEPASNTHTMPDTKAEAEVTATTPVVSTRRSTHPNKATGTAGPPPTTATTGEA